MQWTRVDTDITTTNEDLKQCAQQAHLKVIRQSLPSVTVVPGASGDYGRTVSILAAPATMQSEEQRQEFELATTCMHQKGYKLAPLTERPPVQP